ncbi:DNA binding protein, putative [Ricinus communis]|uniref:DNA binding protein, putative n=2 Tax=Ricinus communis TaxID=3988 RepID=B9T107_RICCO|nr:DNA binding protein, putative [Ricinus communis]
MGIDPLTHKPLPTTETPSSPTSPPPLPSQEQKQEQEVVQEQQQNMQSLTCSNSNTMAELEQNKETETSIQSTVTEEAKVDHEDKSTFDTMEIMINGFCIDEVPLIEPHEMLVHCAAPSSSSTTATATASTSSSSSSSSSTSSSCHDPSNNNNNNNNNLFEEWHFSDFEWPNNDIDLWGDELSSCWDLLMNDAAADDTDRKLQAVDPPLNQCQRMDFDQDSWTYGIL